MALADDLLEQAYSLANSETGEPKQASLRRAVSTAYYALFHLLVEEAVSNWRIARQRSALARTLDHGRLRAVCNDQIKIFQSAGRPASGIALKDVSKTFVELQSERHTADYDNSVIWTRDDALTVVEDANKAFKLWREIRNDDEAQDFLFKLFFPKPPRA